MADLREYVYEPSDFIKPGDLLSSVNMKHIKKCFRRMIQIMDRPVCKYL